MNVFEQYNKLVFVITLFLSNTVIAEDIRIALRAYQGADAAIQQWQATADHLSEKIPGYRFVMVPFENNSALNQAVSQGDFHFSLTNPASAVEQRIRYGALPLATLVNKRQGKGYSKFGSVIFTRFDRDDINTFADLKGKTFIGADELGFGGWRVAWRELLKNDINPYTDFKEVRFAGGKQPAVVYAVRDGNADAGSVRTDMLERMAATGKINLDNYKVLGQKITQDFPFLHSTQLYPEWLFSSVSNLDNKFKTQVAATLFSIPDDSTSAINGKYIGWISPLDYNSVETLLKELKVGPYHVAIMSPLQRLISQYGKVIIIVIALFISLSLIILYMMKQNRRLTKAQNSLKNEIATREMLEQQIVRIQKMESLGQLTGGIAHDFNNMLAIILGFTELSLGSKAVTKDSDLVRYLRQVTSTVDKAKMLVKQMLTFSRSEGSIDQTEVVFTSDLIEEVFQLLRPLLPSSIDLVIKDSDKDLPVNVSKQMVNQVLINLFLNAKDSISDNQGVITICAEETEFEHAQCSSCHQDFSGTYIAIIIEDSGRGIDADSKERIFEPFFTTKEIGKGTGMGLSMAHGIIHNHGGHILLDSEVDRGTIVKILLPQVAETAGILPFSKIAHSLKNDTEKSSKHILIIDDEESITIYLNELLQRHGYKVTALNDSELALTYFEKHHENIDLVVTDQTMPNITGIDVAVKMLSLSKDMPIILNTGHSEQTDEQKALNLNIRAYMKKPVRADELLHTISALVR